jgi:hypothetical protein
LTKLIPLSIECFSTSRNGREHSDGLVCGIDNTQNGE